MQLYANPNRPDHAHNNAIFLEIVNDYPILDLFQPNPAKAPWHWQAVIKGEHYDQLLNFWPHSGKAQRDGYQSVEGSEAIRRVIEQAIVDATEEPFDVIEG